MERYFTSSEIAEKWQVSERSVRNYCAQGRVNGAQLAGKTWLIPAEAEKPGRKKRIYNSKRFLLQALRNERSSNYSGGIYSRIQTDFASNSCRIDGNRISPDQIRYIYETDSIDVAGTVKVDDIIEIVNHFHCLDFIIDTMGRKLSPQLICNLHKFLKNGTTDTRYSWFAIGEYKKTPNEINGQGTILPENVSTAINWLLYSYSSLKDFDLDAVLDFHVRFERIHPFQDGNGRIGRLIMFRECLKHNIPPFIIHEDSRADYYRGLSEWYKDRWYLQDLCIREQKRFRMIQDRFRTQI